MRTLLILHPSGITEKRTYETREPPLSQLQSIVGGYVEHVAVTYTGKRRSAYVVDSYARLRVTSERSRESILAPNEEASCLVGQPIVGTMIIDLGDSHA